MISSQYQKYTFYALGVGLKNDQILVLQRLAVAYHHQFISTKTFDTHIRTNFHACFVSFYIKNYETVVHELQMQYPNALIITIFDDYSDAKDFILTDKVFFVLTVENKEQLTMMCHQLWRWILTMNYQKNKIDQSCISIAGGLLSLTEEIYEKSGKTHRLTGNQYSLLNLLWKKRGQIVSRMEIMETIWIPQNKIVTDRVIDTNIVALRKIFEDDGKNPKYLQTIFGIGYRLNFE